MMETFEYVPYSRWGRNNFVNVCGHCGATLEYLDKSDSYVNDWHYEHEHNESRMGK